jgi:hypothetical protein
MRAGEVEGTEVLGDPAGIHQVKGVISVQRATEADDRQGVQADRARVARLERVPHARVAAEGDGVLAGEAQKGVAANFSRDVRENLL